MIKDCKNISYFKRAILIGSRTGVYFNQKRYTLIKIKGKESWKKNERNRSCLKQVLLGTQAIKQTASRVIARASKVITRDHSGQRPVHLLREHYTGNRAI